MTGVSERAEQPQPSWSAAAPQRIGPAEGLAYGGFWIRTVAWIIDAVALGILTSAIAPLWGMGTVIPTNGFTVDYGTNALGTLLGVVYFVGFWAWRGQTLGMMPFNLRVVRAEDGGTLDVVRALLRYVGLIISFVVLLIGVIWVAFDGRKQGWHDKMANTVVVRPG